MQPPYPHRNPNGGQHFDAQLSTRSSDLSIQSVGPLHRLSIGMHSPERHWNCSAVQLPCSFLSMSGIHFSVSSSEPSTHSRTPLHSALLSTHAPYRHWNFVSEHWNDMHSLAVSSLPSEQSATPLHRSAILMHSPFSHSQVSNELQPLSWPAQRDERQNSLAFVFFFSSRRIV